MIKYIGYIVVGTLILSIVVWVSWNIIVNKTAPTVILNKAREGLVTVASSAFNNPGGSGGNPNDKNSDGIIHDGIETTFKYLKAHPMLENSVYTAGGITLLYGAYRVIKFARRIIRK